MRARPSDDELRSRTAEAARHAMEAGEGWPEKPKAGDLYVSDASADFPVQWLVLGADPARPGRFLVVAADTAPFTAAGDIAVPADVGFGPLTVRPRFTASVEARELASDHRVGVLPERFALQVRDRAADLASGSLQPTVLEEETDADPEYRDWVAEVLEPACAALAAGGRERPSEIVPPAMRTARWPQALAALFLLTSIGLSVWVVELRRRVELLQAPALVRGFEVAVGDPTRGTETIKIPSGAMRILVEVVLYPGVPTYELYRIELRDGQGRERLALPPQPPPPRSVYRLELTAARFPDGEYTLAVYGLSREGPEKIDERTLILTRGP